MPIAAITAAMRSGGCQPPAYAPANHAGDMSAENDPDRPMASESPIAKAIRPPANQSMIATVIAMFWVSAPIPKSRRPVAIVVKSGPNAVSTAPDRQTAVLQRSMRAAP